MCFTWELDGRPPKSKEQKQPTTGCRSERERKWRIIGGGETVIRVYGMKKNTFSIRRKRKKKTLKGPL